MLLLLLLLLLLLPVLVPKPLLCCCHAAALAAGLRALADQLEDEEDVLLPAAVDTFAADFLRARICPHPAQLPDQGMWALVSCTNVPPLPYYLIIPWGQPSVSLSSAFLCISLCAPF